ncbi:MAG: GntR family transcriptional regulator [Butyricicoccaceae bacterium]
MTIVIQNTSELPIYEQIAQQIKQQILSGALHEGDALPSIRALAKELRISVITTKRAYEELERDGFLYTVAGKGSFVAAQNLSLIKEEYLKRIEEHLQEVVDLAAICELSIDDIITMLHTLSEE